MSNYPDSVNPGDPRAPWNLREPEPAEYAVYLTICVYVEALDADDAKEKADDALADGEAFEVIEVQEVERQ